MLKLIFENILLTFFVSFLLNVTVEYKFEAVIKRSFCQIGVPPFFFINLSYRYSNILSSPNINFEKVSSCSLEVFLFCQVFLAQHAFMLHYVLL